ncbi:hypothetical protein F9K33_14315 [bacterium]|nr:MAG: hypothetical protein F9K33_14315 [bacterium]
MSKQITVALLFVFIAISCTEDDKNALEGTKWYLDDDGTPEYVYFKTNTFDDYYFDSEFTCFEHSELPYSVSENKLNVLGLEFTFEKTASTLTLIDHADEDTVMFVAVDFDADTLDICSPEKRLGKSFFNK